MGLMICERNNCENIMCDTYIDDIGYVCFDCQDEFKEFLEGDDFTEGVIRKALKEFMSTEKETYKEDDKKITINNFFRENTK